MVLVLSRCSEPIQIVKLTACDCCAMDGAKETERAGTAGQATVESGKARAGPRREAVDFVCARGAP